MSSQQLFDHVHIIKLERVDGKLQQNASYQFPPGQNFSEEVKTVCQFCFPEGEIPKASTAHKSHGQRKRGQTFSFVLTSTDGSKQYGYCRRYLDKSSAECICVVSLVPSMALFSQVLDIIEEKRTLPHTAVFTVLKSVLALPFPEPGDSVVVHPLECDEYTLTRPKSETLADYVSLASIFRSLSVDTAVELFAGLLCEQRVLVGAQDPEVLSQTMQALCALIFPLTWQHVFIPILPKSLVGYVTAPMPFLIGCLHSSLVAIRDMGMPLEEIYMLQADTGAILMRPSGAKSLPPDVEGPLRNSLSAIVKPLSKGGNGSASGAGSADGGSDTDAAIARAFLRAVQALLAGYEKFFVSTKPKERRTVKPLYFDADAFVESKPQDYRPFLRGFFGSQIWFMFMADREALAAKGELQKSCPLLAQQPRVPVMSVAECGFAGQCACGGCGKIVTQGEPCSAWEGTLYHTKCFKCAECGALLEGLQKVGGKDGVPTCGVCKRNQRSLTIAEVIEVKGSSSAASASSSISSAISSSFGKMKSFLKDKSKKHGKHSDSTSPSPPGESASTSSSSSSSTAATTSSTSSSSSSSSSMPKLSKPSFFSSKSSKSASPSPSQPSSSSSSSTASSSSTTASSNVKPTRSFSIESSTKPAQTNIKSTKSFGGNNNSGGGNSIVGNSPFVKSSNAGKVTTSTTPPPPKTTVTTSRSTFESKGQQRPTTTSSFTMGNSQAKTQPRPTTTSSFTMRNSQVRTQTAANKPPTKKTGHVPPSRPPPGKKQIPSTAPPPPPPSAKYTTTSTTKNNSSGTVRPQTTNARTFAGFK